MLRTHYHQPMDWTVAGLDESHTILLSWYEDLPKVSDSEMPSPEILDALCDDLNTPEVITRLHRLKRQGKSAALGASLRLLGFSGDRERLGRKFHDKVTEAARATMETRATMAASEEADSAQVNAETFPTRLINALLTARDEARKTGNFAEADRIREELKKMRIVLKDSKEGTTWEVER